MKVPQVPRLERRLQTTFATLFFSLGLIMPIDTIATIPPALVDVARYGLAVVILLGIYTRRRSLPKPPLVGVVSFLLITSGVLAVLKGAFLSGELLAAVVSLGSALIAFLLVREHRQFRPLLLGFLTGCLWSAVDIIMQFMGLPFLGTQSQYGFRHAGFSFSSTQVAPLLATAICLVITPWIWERRRALLRVILTCVLGSGLLLSQGRVGVAGILAALVLLFFIWMRQRPAVTFLVAGGASLFLYFSGAMAALLEYILRHGGTGDFTSGRLDINLTAWNAFWTGGVLGVDPGTNSLLNPHIAPLSAGVNIGPFGLVATSIVCILLVWVALFSPDTPTAFRMIAVVAFVTAMLEPSGFFVGFTKVVLLLICFSNTTSTTETAERYPGTTDVSTPYSSP